MLQATVPNLRAEIARHKIKNKVLAEGIGINYNQLCIILREERPMRGDLSYKVAQQINKIVGEEIFSVPAN